MSNNQRFLDIARELSGLDEDPVPLPVQLPCDHLWFLERKYFMCGKCDSIVNRRVIDLSKYVGSTNMKQLLDSLATTT